MTAEWTFLDHTFRIGEETLPYVRQGLNEETAQKICEIIRDIAEVDAVAVTDRQTILGYAGLGCPFMVRHQPILTQATRNVLATGQLRLKATLPNADGTLWPGQFVNVRLLLRTERGMPTVPSTAVQRGPDGTWLYVVQPDGTVAVQPVAVRRFGGGLAVLEGGPPAGTRIVALIHGSSMRSI